MRLVGKTVYYKNHQDDLEISTLDAENVQAITVGDGFVEIVYTNGDLSFIPMHNVYEVYLKQEEDGPNA